MKTNALCLAMVNIQRWCAVTYVHSPQGGWLAEVTTANLLQDHCKATDVQTELILVCCKM